MTRRLAGANKMAGAVKKYLKKKKPKNRPQNKYKKKKNKKYVTHIHIRKK